MFNQILAGALLGLAVLAYLLHPCALGASRKGAATNSNPGFLHTVFRYFLAKLTLLALCLNHETRKTMPREILVLACQWMLGLAGVTVWSAFLMALLAMAHELWLLAQPHRQPALATTCTVLSISFLTLTSIQLLQNAIRVTAHNCFEVGLAILLDQMAFRPVFVVLAAGALWVGRGSETGLSALEGMRDWLWGGQSGKVSHHA
jgi:hypothetical protein